MRVGRLLIVLLIILVVFAGVIMAFELFYKNPSRKVLTIKDLEAKYRPVEDDGTLNIRHVDEPLDVIVMEDAVAPQAQDKEAILLIHGAFGSAEMWQHIIESADWPNGERAKYQFVMPSLYGHGNSPKDKELLDYSVREHVDAIVDVLRKNVPNGRPLHVVGLSLGGPLSVAVCARLVRTFAPWPLKSLTLLAPAYFSSTDRAIVMREIGHFRKNTLPNTMYLCMKHVFPRLRFLVEPIMKTFAKKRYNKTPHRTEMVKQALGTDFHGLASSCESVIIRYNVDAGFATLRSIDLPVLVIDGERDKMYFSDPMREKLLKAAGEKSRRIVVKGGSHMFCVEKARELIGHLVSFYADLKRANSSIVVISRSNQDKTDSTEVAQ